MMPGIPVQSPVDNRGFHVKQVLGSGSAPSHLLFLALSAAFSNCAICSGLNTSFLALVVRIGRTAATGLRSINPSSRAILKGRFKIFIVWFTVRGDLPPESHRSLNARIVSVDNASNGACA